MIFNSIFLKLFTRIMGSTESKAFEKYINVFYKLNGVPGVPEGMSSIRAISTNASRTPYAPRSVKHAHERHKKNTHLVDIIILLKLLYYISIIYISITCISTHCYIIEIIVKYEFFCSVSQKI